MADKYILSPVVIKRYEPELDIYYFYNAQKKLFWQCDYSTGSVVSYLDGSLSETEIIDIISESNPDIPKDAIRTKLSETFEFLLNEEFIYET